MLGGARCDPGALGERLALARGVPALAMLDYGRLAEIELPEGMHVVLVDPPASAAQAAWALHRAGRPLAAPRLGRARDRRWPCGWPRTSGSCARPSPRSGPACATARRAPGGPSSGGPARRPGASRSPRVAARALAVLGELGLVEVGDAGVRAARPSPPRRDLRRARARYVGRASSARPDPRPDGPPPPRRFAPDRAIRVASVSPGPSSALARRSPLTTPRAAIGAVALLTFCLTLIPGRPCAAEAELAADIKSILEAVQTSPAAEPHPRQAVHRHQHHPLDGVRRPGLRLGRGRPRARSRAAQAPGREAALPAEPEPLLDAARLRQQLLRRRRRRRTRPAGPLQHHRAAAPAAAPRRARRHHARLGLAAARPPR